LAITFQAMWFNTRISGIRRPTARRSSLGVREGVTSVSTTSVTSFQLGGPKVGPSICTSSASGLVENCPKPFLAMCCQTCEFDEFPWGYLLAQGSVQCTRWSRD
jgi:hypothetical protein